MTFEIVCAVLFVFVVGALYWTIVKKASAKISEQYSNLSKELGIEKTQPDPQLVGFLRPEPFLHGIYRGRTMSISVPGKGLQNTRQIETTLKVEVSDERLQWQMTVKDLLSRIRQRDSGSMEQWKSLHAVFDREIDVRTNEPARLSYILNDARLEEIMAVLKGSKASIYMGAGKMVYTKFGLISNDEERRLFRRVTVLLCDLADLVDERSL